MVLILNIQNLFDKSVIRISIDSIVVLNDEAISIVLKINNYTSEEIEIEI